MLSRRQFVSGLIGSVLPSDMQGPILRPDQPWEGSCAMPFSGGIYQDGYRFRCYYLANYNRVCLAFSENGLTWTKPDLGIIPGTNILLHIAKMDSFSVVPHAGQWYMVTSTRSGGPLRLFTSRLGYWFDQVAVMPWAGDRSTLWWNPVKARWTFNVRNGAGTDHDPRRIDRVESETFIPKTWQPDHWLRAQLDDGPGAGGGAQLYAVDVVPDRNRLVGLFTIWRGAEPGRPKLNDVCLGFSEDGDTWTRQYEPVLTRSEGRSWRWGNVQGCTGGLIRIGDRVRLYASGRDGRDGGNGQCAMGYREMVI